MNIGDRIKQAGTATSDAVYVLGGAASTGFRTFNDGFHFPTTGAMGGDLDYEYVPILVETSTDWQIIVATVRRSSAGVVSVLDGVVKESSTGSALGLTGAEAVTLSVVPSYWLYHLVDFGTYAPTDDSQRFTRRTRCDNSGLMALGPRSFAAAKWGTAQGYNAYNHIAAEQCVGIGNWPEAGNGAAMRARFVWQAFTTSATAEKMAVYDEDGLIANSDRVPCDSGLYVVKGQLTAINHADFTQYKVWDVLFAVHTDDAYSATAIVGTPTFTEVHEAAGTTAWEPSATVDSGNNTFSLEVTGEAAKNITWCFTGDLHSHIAYP